ncbi:hypothetical protein N7539_004349 [Penicillium diatomitis]|uniref:Uncharacterized protein n=1 Tax=Penicillium diatomitis TaxID=2819901 RepID=A0A9W9XDM7_9EURO|nr:uncharacterized protein N7539_004349 [Penicillium diatomitis]KAJ5489459.1 hypothetical protein N7539_004349 [Penicillium diatomitis]
MIAVRPLPAKNKEPIPCIYPSDLTTHDHLRLETDPAAGCKTQSRSHPCSPGGGAGDRTAKKKKEKKKEKKKQKKKKEKKKKKKKKKMDDWEWGNLRKGGLALIAPLKA